MKQVTSNPHDPDRLHEILDAAEDLTEHVLIGVGLDADSRLHLTQSDPWRAFRRLVREHPCNQPHSDLMGQDLQHDLGQIDMRMETV